MLSVDQAINNYFPMKQPYQILQTKIRNQKDSRIRSISQTLQPQTCTPQKRIQHYVTKTFQMRKKEIKNGFLPKTLDEYNKRLQQKNEIENLEASFYQRGNEKKLFKFRQFQYMSHLKSITSRFNKTKIHDTSLNFSTVFQENQNAFKYQKQTSDQKEETENSLKSQNSALKIIQQEVSQRGAPKLWTTDHLYQLKDSVQQFKSKWQRILDEDFDNEIDRQVDEIKQGWTVYNGKQGQNLDLESVKFIEKEFNIPEDMRDYQELDRLLINLQFFKRFQKGVRIGLIESCSFQKYKNNESVYQQNQKDQDMYIIVRGSVTLRQIELDVKNQQIQKIIGSYYDGQHFGDSSETNEFQLKNYIRRNCTATCNEDTFLLKMPKDRFEGLLYKAADNEVDQKIKTVLSISLFSNCPPNQILSLVSILQLHIYKMGEYLVKQNQKIDSMLLIMEGCCKVVYENYTSKEMNSIIFPQERTRLLFKEQKDQTSRYWKNNKPSLSLQKSRLKNFEKVKFNDKTLQVTEQYLVKEIKNGDIIGGRSLLSSEDMINKVAKYPPDYKISRLSVIANSTEVKTFGLDRQQFLCLPDQLQQNIILGLQKEIDYDYIPLESFKKEQLQWNTFKQGYYSGLVQSKIERRKLGIL